MKEWLQQTVAGDGAVEGSLQQALLDLIWMMPWWAPYLILAAAGLWLLCLGLARRRPAVDVAPASEEPVIETPVVERRIDPVVKRSPKRLRLVA